MATKIFGRPAVWTDHHGRRRTIVMLSPSGLSGVGFGIMAGGAVGGPAGALVGAVIGGVAGEALEHAVPSGHKINRRGTPTTGL